jgi:hypothetical protein
MTDTQSTGTRRISQFDLAAETITHERQSSYGPPLPSFNRIAALWSSLLGVEITAQQVAHMMILLKVSRLQSSPNDLDTLIDIVGYARCAVLCGPEYTNGFPSPC